jgi:hypothetical protein
MGVYHNVIERMLSKPTMPALRSYLSINDAFFSNANNVSFGTSNGSIVTASASFPPAAVMAISAGTESQSTGTVIFSNSNGISFGLNAGTLTASHNAITSQSNQAASASNGSFTFQTLGFSNANNVTFGTSAGSIITASVAPAGAASVNFSAGTTSNNLSAVTFSNSNNITFGLDAGTITASIFPPLNLIDDPTSDARFLMNTRQVQFQWGTNLSTFTTAAARQALFEVDVIGNTNFATQSTDNVDVMHIHQSAATLHPFVDLLHLEAAGTNALPLRISAAGSIAAILNNPISYDAGSVPMILGTSQSNVVSNLNAFYLEGARSSQFLTSQSNQAASASNGSFTFQTLNFSNANNVTFGTSAGGIVTASVAPAGGGDAIRGIAAGASTATTNTVNFSNSNGISFGFGAAANSTVITASHNALTAVAASASNGSFTFQTLNFSNASNVTFATSAGGIIAASVAAQSTQPVAASASNGSFTFATLGFSNANNVTFGTSAGSIITASVAAPGGAGVARSYFQWPECVAASITFQVSGVLKYIQPFRLPYDLSVSYMRLPLTCSCVGSNAATATAANQTVGATISSTFQLAFYSLGTGASSRSLQSYYTTSHSWVQRLSIQAGATGSHWSSGHTISYPMSSSASAAFTASGAATSASRTMNSTVISNFTNERFLDLLMGTSFSAGAWWVAFNSSTSLSTSVSNWLSTQRILASNFAVQQPSRSYNLMGVATNSSNLYVEGLGSWSTDTVGTTTASIGLSQLSRVAANYVPNFQLIRQA